MWFPKTKLLWPLNAVPTTLKSISIPSPRYMTLRRIRKSTGMKEWQMVIQDLIFRLWMMYFFFFIKNLKSIVLKRLQASMMEYLKGYGVTEEVAALVEHLSLDKEQRLYMNWLKEVSDFIGSN